MSKKERLLEKLWIALLLTFISGFNNAYTYLTQGGRFAGNQTGNFIYLGMNLAQGKWREVFSYALPIFVFIVGQFFVYNLRQWASRHKQSAYVLGLEVMMAIYLLTIVVTPVVSSHIVIALLALFASIQLEIFKKVGHTAYANVMMTGNLKNGSYSLIKGLKEHNPGTVKNALEKFAIIGSFVMGVMTSVWVTPHLGEGSLLLIFPLLVTLFVVIRYQLTKKS